MNQSLNLLLILKEFGRQQEFRAGTKAAQGILEFLSLNPGGNVQVFHGQRSNGSSAFMLFKTSPLVFAAQVPCHENSHITRPALARFLQKSERTNVNFAAVRKNITSPSLHTATLRQPPANSKMGWWGASGTMTLGRRSYEIHR